jgi:hypothetical protein
MVGMTGWGEPFGTARKTTTITRMQAIAIMGSLYFFNTDVDCRVTGSFGGCADGE